MRLIPLLIALLLTIQSACGQSDVVRLWRILDGFNKLYGGGRDAQTMSAIVVEGKQAQGGQIFDFSLRKKRPNSIRYRMSSGDNVILTGYNGSVGWLQVFGEDGVTLEDMEGDSLAMLQDEADFDGPLLRYIRYQEGTVTLAESVALDGEVANVLNVEASSGRNARYYLSMHSSHILKRELLKDDGSVLLETLYRDYRDVSGFPFAHVVENYADGELLSRTEVEQVRVNPGLLSFYFEKPQQ